jgi:hypothetical protein
MALKDGKQGTVKVVVVLLTPSWPSGLFAVLVGLLASGGTIALARLGSATEQSLIGLHSVYRQSSLGASSGIVGQHLSSNTLFNNAVLFVLWGSVGLVVYSIVQGLANEFRNTDDLLHEMKFVHADRSRLVYDTTLRALTRFGALAAWWIVAWTMLHKIFPYTITTAHFSAHNPSDIGRWLQTLLGFAACVLGIHVLTILLRLILLRPRLRSNSILDS